jgi:hypothetical protein
VAEIKAAIGRQFQSLSIVFVCAVNTKLASLFRLKFSLQIYMDYMELTGSNIIQHCWMQHLGLVYAWFTPAISPAIFLLLTHVTE